MNSKTTTEVSSGEGSVFPSGTKMADVIPIHKESQGAVTLQTDYTINDQPNLSRSVTQRSLKFRKEFGYSISGIEDRSRADSELIDYAYDSIVDASDGDIERIERSNLFDQWKDYVEDIVSEITNISVKHRKILGALMVIVKGRDISDFERRHLTIFRETTYMIRQFKLSKRDVERTINSLMTIKNNLELPLSVEGITPKDEKDLNNLMEDLIERSR